MGNEASGPRDDDGQSRGENGANGSSSQQSRSKVATFLRGGASKSNSGRSKALNSYHQDAEGSVSNHHPLHRQNGDVSAHEGNSNQKYPDRQGNARKQRKKNQFSSGNRGDKNRVEQQGGRHLNTPRVPPDHLQPVMFAASRSTSSVRTGPSSVPPRGDISEITMRTGDISMSESMGQGGNQISQGISNDQEQWKNKWFDDTESSDDDDDCSDSDEGNSIGAALTGKHVEGPLIGVTGAPAHQVLRPALDGGHSSSFPMRVENIDDLADLSTFSKDPQQGQLSLPPSHPLYAQYREQSQTTPQHFTKSHNSEENTTSRNCDQINSNYEEPSPAMFFPLLRVLGKGSFGKVVLVQKQNGSKSGGLFAMKILKKTHLQKRGQIERTKTERKVLSVIRHPFIMKLHFAFQTDEKLFFVLDYCAGGELFFHLSRARRFSEKWARFYAGELLLALGHCHDNGIIYRDLKPENVLLDSDGHVKLGDFGLAKDNITHAYRGANSMCGTPEYMAPEILQQLGHGWCVDYWGLGMLVYEMMTGLPPWYTKDRPTLYRRLKSAPLDIPPFFSSKASSFIYSLLQRDPRRRLGVGGKSHVMAHKFFLELDFEHLINRRIDPPIPPCEAWRKHESEYEKNENEVRNNGNDYSHLIKSSDLDVATANFDKQFLRMPVNSHEHHEDANNSEGEVDGQELNENTFVGFTFDEHNTATNSF